MTSASTVGAVDNWFIVLFLISLLIIAGGLSLGIAYLGDKRWGRPLLITSGVVGSALGVIDLMFLLALGG